MQYLRTQTLVRTVLGAGSTEGITGLIAALLTIRDTLPETGLPLVAAIQNTLAAGACKYTLRLDH